MVCKEIMFIFIFVPELTHCPFLTCLIEGSLQVAYLNIQGLAQVFLLLPQIGSNPFLHSSLEHFTVAWLLSFGRKMIQIQYIYFESLSGTYQEKLKEEKLPHFPFLTNLIVPSLQAAFSRKQILTQVFRLLPQTGWYMFLLHIILQRHLVLRIFCLATTLGTEQDQNTNYFSST